MNLDGGDVRDRCVLTGIPGALLRCSIAGHAEAGPGPQSLAHGVTPGRGRGTDAVKAANLTKFGTVPRYQEFHVGAGYSA